MRVPVERVIISEVVMILVAIAVVSSVVDVLFTYLLIGGSMRKLDAQ